jgi:uroporphyrinogen decarboxylase
MRQAGRYLPEYRALRSKHSLRELFFTPELAAHITLMPIERFNLDAAILFSDITIVAPALGFQLEFDEGPIITPWVTPETQFSKADLTQLEPIFETVRLVKQRSNVPLIGFCGGPFTVASYLIEKHAGTHWPKTRAWMQSDPRTFKQLLDRICDVSIDYLQGQIAAGVDAIQIFDSWAGLLSEEEFSLWSLNYLKRIIQEVERPVIVFMRGSAVRAKEIEQVGAAAVSVDWELPLSSVRKEVRCALQGNLCPDLLFQPVEEVRRQTQCLLDEMRGDSGFIVNLGHGVKVGTPVESVAALVETVHAR